MHVDLLTLYFLAVGTLLVSAAMTFWECRAHPRRRKELKILAAGYATLALGCAMVIALHGLPGMWGSAMSNLVIVAGYLLIMQGVAVLGGRSHRATSIVILVALALAWLIGGEKGQALLWNYASSIPIAIVAGITAWEFLRGGRARPQAQTRYIGAALLCVHTVLYAARTSILPWAVASYGPAVLAFAGKMTIYEGVLYSVILPMTLLKIVREEAHDELRRESQTDYLTRLGNRRWFFEEGTRVVAGNRQHGAMSLLAFDLDQFKRINDQYGHKMGDDVLRSLAEVATVVLGPEAILARIGGDEFVALLPGHDRKRAEMLGQALAARFAETARRGNDGCPIEVTISVGLAQLGADSPDLAASLAAADEALYEAKSLGGNRLVLSPARPGASPVV